MKTKFYLSFLTLLITNTQTAQAQYQPTNRTPISDNTLGTIVNPTNFNITGGLSKGQTLFHSFTDFSIPTNGQANFINPIGNRDIITRVTGKLFSDINGTINTNNANFFLINPNGIVFGTNAKLNVGKAFIGSTANSLDLIASGGKTITFGTNQSGDALLKIAPNVLFNASQLNISGNGSISNFGTLQTPNNSQYIGLIGGNITLDGGKIIAPGGRIDIGGLNNGSVTVDNNGLVFSSNQTERSNVLLTNGAGIIVRATAALAPVNTFFNGATSNGSSINISANNLDILNSGAKLAQQPAAIDAGLEKNSIQLQPAGDINIDATGKVNLNQADIKNTLNAGSAGTIGDIKIQANTLDVRNHSFITSTTRGKGNAGNIDLNVTGDINISGRDSFPTNPTPSDTSAIGSNTYAQGDAGKITINTQGKLSIFNLGGINSDIGDTGVGNGQGIFITARELDLVNSASISTGTFQSAAGIAKGNGGNINIKTTGDIKLSGSDSSVANPASSFSYISSDIQGYGDAGNITIDTQGKLSLANRSQISTTIQDTAVGNSNGIAIAAKEVNITTNSSITTTTYQTTQVKGKGNAGDINIKTTGDINLFGYDLSTKPTLAYIASDTNGQGDAGKITIDAQGKISLTNYGVISSTISANAVGNSKGIAISARELELNNDSLITTSTLDNTQGNAGDIKIKTTGNIKISGKNSSISSFIAGKGDGGQITIDTQGNLSALDGGSISNFINSTAIGNAKNIFVTARNIELANNSRILSSTSQTAPIEGTGKAGDINLNATDSLSLSNRSYLLTTSFGIGQAGNININTGNLLSVSNKSFLSTGSFETGQAGNLSVTSGQLFLDNSYFSTISNSNTGGNINIAISDKLLMENTSFISTNSDSTNQNGNGGNITINSPLIVALPGNNDITANANQGTGGRVDITSQGLFGIKYRAQAAPLTNDITASSTFGQNGTVNITTPGTDPGKDSTQLPNTATDASNQISQVCGNENRQNKLTVAGRGGLPPNANDPLTSDVIWQDARAVSSQPVASSAKTNPLKLAPPAVGLVFDGKGKVTLVAANTEGQTTRTNVICPSNKP